MKTRIEQAIDILDKMDDAVTELGGDDDDYGRSQLSKIRRIKGHLRRERNLRCKVWLAVMASRSFEFKAIGDSEDDAFANLRAGLEYHCKKYRIAKFWDDSDINVMEMKRGFAYRDYDEV